MDGDSEADGSFIYTPTTLYFGTDTFTYKANDGQTNSATATVTITVNTLIIRRWRTTTAIV